MRRALSHVGIHRGYIDTTQKGPIDLNDAIKLYQIVKKPIADYLNEMGVPRRYADIMLQTGSTELYFPTYPEVVRDFYGWIPEIKEWLIAECKTVTDRQIEEEKNRAFRESFITGEKGLVTRFLALRDDRETCIQVALVGERTKRRKALAKRN